MLQPMGLVLLAGGEHPDGGSRLRPVVVELAWSDRRLLAAREVIRTRAARLTLIGRVPAWAWMN